MIASQGEAAPLRAGETVTTGTLTDAWSIVAGERWRSDYGDLGVHGIELAVGAPRQERQSLGGIRT